MGYEGAMLGGYLLPKEQFIEVMAQLLAQQQNDIKISIANILADIHHQDIRLAFKKWDQFQTQLLKNPVTKLLAITHFYNKYNNQTWVYANEIDTLSRNGQINITRLRNIRQGLSKEYYSQVLAQHLGDLFRTVNSVLLDREERNAIYSFSHGEYSGVKSRLSKSLHKQSPNYQYGPIIYGQESVNKRGKVADAFLNHIGKLHENVIAGLDNGNFSNLADSLITHGVRTEERAHASLGFLHLLLESLNHTAWYTGGDLIVVNKYGQVIANIQLKTSAGAGYSVGQIKTAELEQKLIEIQTSLTNKANYVKIAEQFFEMLKTSTVSEHLGTAIYDTGIQLARENLGL